MTHDSTGLVSVTEAAARLTREGDRVERSTLSRYITKHADALQPQTRGRDTLIDFAKLKEHRGQNIRLADAKPHETQRSRSDEGAANLRAQRQLRELDIAERLKTLAPRADVENAAYSAVAALKTAFAGAVSDTAEAIAAACSTEARLVRPHLRTLERLALEAFVKELAKQDFEPKEPAAA